MTRRRATLDRPRSWRSPPARPAGYWLVAADGGIFAFGDAPFFGSMGGEPLNAPIVGMAATPDGDGYWLVAADGGIFAFGDAPFLGSMGGQPLNRRSWAWPPPRRRRLLARGLRRRHLRLRRRAVLRLHRRHAPQQADRGHGRHPDGGGYWLVASDGGIFAFGDAAFYGSTGADPPEQAGRRAWPRSGGDAATGSCRPDGGIFAFGGRAVLGIARLTSSVICLVCSCCRGGRRRRLRGRPGRPCGALHAGQHHAAQPSSGRATATASTAAWFVVGAVWAGLPSGS